MKIKLNAVLIFSLLVLLAFALGHPAWCEEFGAGMSLPDISIDGQKMSEPAKVSTVMQVGMAMTSLSLAPTLLVLCTAFTRVTITMSFLRQALGTQQVPPTQVLMGLGIFITIFVMAPVGREIHDKAFQPYIRNEIKQEEFFVKAARPLREFMLRQTRSKDLILFAKMSRTEVVKKRIELPMYVVCPAYVLSEIQTSFEIGFLLYLPFLIVDIVVSTILMTGGMHMLSPGTLALPFKLLLFVTIDGWHLIVNGLIQSFNTEKI
jgi:flagellar biosynthesis protein FliP